MSAPVNVKLQNPTITVSDWTQQAAEWMQLNSEIGGNPEFFPLTIKAAYVIGVIHSLCESVRHLLAHPTARETTYIPAYGVFASGVELLGRCINGNSTTHGTRTGGGVSDLTTGFKWLASSSYTGIPITYNLVTTNNSSYTIEMLAALRHFAAHGQATSRVTNTGMYQFGNIDYEILSHMPGLIANGLWRIHFKIGQLTKRMAMCPDWFANCLYKVVQSLFESSIRTLLESATK